MILVMHRFLIGELPESLNKLYNKENIIRNRRQKRHLKEPFSNQNYRLFTTTLKVQNFGIKYVRVIFLTSMRYQGLNFRLKTYEKQKYLVIKF